MSGSGFVRYAEAVQLISETSDSKRKAALQFALTRAIRASEQPVEPFDLVFFLGAVDRLFENEPALRAILDGRQQELEWWEEDE